jgi:hypothetical protein
MLFCKVKKLIQKSESFFIKKNKVWKFHNIFLKKKYYWKDK